MPPFDGAKKALLWGVDTKDPKASGRRTFIDHLPIDTTREDVLEFFGKDTVEGMYIGNHFGYVQFKRPLDMTAALKKHNTDFKGTRIIVLRDLKYNKHKPTRLPTSSRSDSRLSDSNGGDSSRRINGQRISVSPPSRRSGSTRTTRPRSRSPGWTRGRSRSQSRDRVIPVGTPPRSSYRGRSRSPSRGSDAMDFSSTNNYSRFEPDRHIMAPAPIPPRRHPLANYSNEFRDSVNGEVPFIMPQTQQHTSQLALISTGELPNSIDLSLKLVMSQKTAKVLTVNQIQDIINYFEMEKAALINLNGTLVSTSLSVPSQQLFYNSNTPAISYPTNDNSVSQLRPAQFSASREPESAPVLDVAQQEQLDDVMRLIRDTTR